MKDHGKRVITPEVMEEYRNVVQQEQLKSDTIKKYLTDAKKLESYLSGEELTQEKLEAFPRWLLEDKKYKKRSVNAMIASARKFCQVMGWEELKVAGYAIDSTEAAEEKYISRREYQRLVTTALYLEKYWLAMLIQTLSHMDIRYAELSGLTVEAVTEGHVEVERQHEAVQMEIPYDLRESLLKYAQRAGITEGILFRTSGGKLLDRSYVWTKVKKLCKEAGIDAGKVSLQRIKMPMVEDYYPFYPMVE